MIPTEVLDKVYRDIYSMMENNYKHALLQGHQGFIIDLKLTVQSGGDVFEISPATTDMRFYHVVGDKA